MVITLDEMKHYLRIDHDDDDAMIEMIMNDAMRICMDVARVDEEAKYEACSGAKTAFMYAVAYMYEHREKAEMNKLTCDLRGLLFASREALF